MLAAECRPACGNGKHGIVEDWSGPDIVPITQRMTLPFRKMHGLGNDFVILDARTQPTELTADQVRLIADRRLGVGCDQLIVLETPDHGGDVRMRIYNSDGGEVTTCGNATRCVADILFGEGLVGVAAIETPAGLLSAWAREDGLVGVDMGAPRFDWKDIPLAERMDTRILDVKIGPIDDPILFGPSAVNVGNPHVVFFVDSVSAYDVGKIGPLVENYPLFPERTNVSFAQVMSRSHVRVRVWERGAGITMACGSAACAVGVLAARKGLTERQVTVELDGGPLGIEWRAGDDHIIMSGPVASVFDGVLSPALLMPTEAAPARRAS